MALLSPAQKVALNEAWKKMLRSFGVSEDLPLNISEGFSNETTQEMTLWVDATNGRDNNSGSESAPVKSITEALNRIPLVVKHNVTVNVKAGTYAETVVISHIIRADGSITISGTEWTSPDVTPASGTFTSVSGQSASMTGATWSVDALRGKFAKITSGTHAGRYFPISSNTADQLTFATSTSGMTGVTFELVEPAATITRGIGRASSVSVEAVAPHQNTIYAALTPNPILVQGFKLIPQAEAADGFVAATPGTGARILSGQALVQSCYIAKAMYHFWVVGASSLGVIKDCYLDTCDLTHLQAADAEAVIIYNTAIYGTTNNSSGVSFENVKRVRIMGSNLRNCTYAGILFRASSPAVNVSDVVIDACGNGSTGGIFIGGGGSYTFSNTTIINANGYGLLASRLFGGGQEAGYVNFSGSITGASKGGIRVNDSYTKVKLVGTNTISNNSGWGVELTESMSQVTVSTGTAMSSNASGDIKISTTVNSTLTDLRADSDKTINDPVMFTLARAE